MLERRIPDIAIRAVTVSYYTSEEEQNWRTAILTALIHTHVSAPGVMYGSLPTCSKIGG
jgi:hypothetical protein